MGMGFMPFGTFDWGTLANSGGYTPMFVPINFIVGLTCGFLLITIFYFRNVLETGHLQPMSPSTWDNKGKPYKVTNIVDSFGRLVPEKYKQYSPPFMTARTLVSTMGTFAYTAASK